MLFLLACSAGAVLNHGGQSPITVQDAKHLLADVPEFISMSSKGWVYFFDAQKFGIEFNNSDFYFFEVSARGKGARTSEIVGHFAVNKWTGEVRDISADEQGVRLTSPQLSKLQAELQKEHGISPRKIQEEQHAHTANFKP